MSLLNNYIFLLTYFLNYSDQSNMTNNLHIKLRIRSFLETITTLFSQYKYKCYNIFKRTFITTGLFKQCLFLVEVFSESS